MKKIYNEYPWVIILIVILMSSISIGIIHYSFSLAHKMVSKHSVHVDATMEAKFEIAQTHLWLEELLSNDISVKPSLVINHIEESRWYLRAMLYGGTNKEGTFIPLDEKHFEMRNKIEDVLAKLDEFQEYTYSRIVNIKESKIASEYDKKYDKSYFVLIGMIDVIETDLQKIIATDLKEYTMIKDFLIFIVIILNIFILFSYKSILTFQKEWIFKYFRIENEKEKVTKLYKDLREAQNLIDAHIPISRTDVDGVIVHVNDAMCELTGFSRNELIGKNYKDLSCPTEKVEKYKEMCQYLLSGDIWQGEIKNVSKCGKNYWTNTFVKPIMHEEDETIVAFQSLEENITDKKELEFLSSHDKLTNIFNRSKFDQLLEYELEQFKRYNQVFSLAIIDLDKFKNVNDTYGHQTGDDVLVESVKVMKNSIRESDVLARWGGEEFVLLLSNTNKDKASIVVEKIRLAIENKVFPTVNSITISCGVSAITKDDTASSLLKRIDDALYQAKNSGRNTIVSA